jgi:branched-chain amino acid transport system substrate-binding protein
MHRICRSFSRAFVLLALGTVLASAACADGSSEPVRIGVAGPFTDPVGLPMKLAAELAAEEINAKGGIDGRPLELLARDDFADPDSAVYVATDLKSAGVAAVIGHLWSGTTIAAAPVYNGGGDAVVAISPSSSAPAVTAAGPWTFRLCPSDLEHGAALARWIRNDLGLERGAVLYLNDEYGRGVRQTFASEFNRLRGTLVAIDPYLGETPDVGIYLDRLAKQAAAQFIVVAGNRGEAEIILRESRRRNFTVPVLGADGLEGIEAIGPLAEGVYISQAYLPTIETPANRRFVEAWRKKYPAAGLPNQPAAATYDAVYLLRDVIGRVGTDRQAVRDALARVGRDSPPYIGAAGRVAFDAAGDLASGEVHMAVVRGGGVIPARSK